ncbi:unnamed protein product [Heterosigma akashiwo]
MAECGAPAPAVRRFVAEKSRAGQLCEDQVLQLNRSIEKILGDREEAERETSIPPSSQTEGQSNEDGGSNHGSDLFEDCQLVEEEEVVVTSL